MIKDNLNIALLKALSEELNISIDELEKVHDSAFKMINKTISKLDFSSMTLEEFRNAKKSFNIPGLGKFYPNERVFVEINKLDKDGK